MCVCEREKERKIIYFYTHNNFLKENLFVFWNKKHIFRSETVFLQSMRFF